MKNKLSISSLVWIVPVLFLFFGVYKILSSQSINPPTPNSSIGIVQNSSEMKNNPQDTNIKNAAPSSTAPKSTARNVFLAVIDEKISSSETASSITEKVRVRITRSYEGDANGSVVIEYTLPKPPRFNLLVGDHIYKFTTTYNTSRGIYEASDISGVVID